MNIDIHNHFYPPEYLKEVEGSGKNTVLKRDEQDRLLLVYSGDYNIVLKSHYDPGERIRMMDKKGLDMQVLTMTTPGVDIEEPSYGVKLTKIVNDAMADVIDKYPGRFSALATLPMKNPEAAVKELERSVEELGLPGAMIFTNVVGEPIDSKRFWPIYEKAEQLNAPIMIHPTSPTDIGLMDPYRLVPLIGFPFETTVAISRLVFSGVLEKYPNVKFILSHLGGTIPYLAERIDRGYYAYPECKGVLTKAPSEYFKKTYMDVVSFYPPAIEFAVKFMGVEKLLLGSDYPHQIGDVSRSIDTIKNLNLQDRDREKIMGNNTLKLLKME